MSNSLNCLINGGSSQISVTILGFEISVKGAEEVKIGMKSLTKTPSL